MRYKTIFDDMGKPLRAVGVYNDIAEKNAAVSDSLLAVDTREPSAGVVISAVLNLTADAVEQVRSFHGRDDREVEPERAMQSIGNEVTFAQDLTQQAQAERELLALAEKVGWRLRQAGVKARTVTLKIRTASFRTITRSRTLPEPTNFDKELYQMALELYRQAAMGEGIRLLGITGSNLLLHEQESLFGIDDKQKKLYQAVDSLKVRFGNTIITKAQLVGRSKKE